LRLVPLSLLLILARVYHLMTSGRIAVALILSSLKTYYLVCVLLGWRDEQWPCWGRARTQSKSQPRLKGYEPLRSGSIPTGPVEWRRTSSGAHYPYRVTRPSPSAPNKTLSDTATVR